MPAKRGSGSRQANVQEAPVNNGAPGKLSHIERIERALVLLAYFIELDGDVHVPLFEKFEAELEEARRGEAVRERARRQP